MRWARCSRSIILSLLLDCGRAVLLHARDLNTALLPSYDYIVVGCGISGLVVANRLSEDDVSVLCIEAGNPDNYEEFIQVPQFVGSDIGSQYDWNLGTAPQTYLDGLPRPMPQGKVLGGGSILNAMCWNRGGADDYNTWEALGNPGWSWQGLLPYFIKSERYTPVYSEEIAQRFSINYNADAHGYNGPVQVSYPRYFYNQSINLFSALNLLGVPTQFDPNDGSSSGAAFIPTDIDPVNQTRSDARRAYFDPYASRPNFHVITGNQVTRILIESVGTSVTVATSTMTSSSSSTETAASTAVSEGLFGEGSSRPPPTINGAGTDAGARHRTRDLPSGLRITGVEFAPNASTPRRTVTATREVIVTAGSLHSAQLLQLSGIGPRGLLERYSIPIAVDLPGVGQNLQDHYLVGTFYPYNNVSRSPAQLAQNATYNAEARAEYYSMKTGPWTAGSPNAVAFPSLPDTSNRTADILLSANDQPPAQYLVPDLDPTLIAGYSAQKDALVRQLSAPNNAAWEIINNNIGSLTVAIMHPFSRGFVEINSINPFQAPTIDPRYGSNPTDLQILMEALLFNRRILATPPMLELQPAQFVPPVDADEDALMQVIANGIRTEFHPSGTCAMLPREQGGVVDPHLRVYGTQNLRVADAGIFPIVPAAHLQAVVYAVAEKAADIIKADNIGVAPSSAPLASSINTSTGVSISTLSSTLSATLSAGITSATSGVSISTSSMAVTTPLTTSSPSSTTSILETPTEASSSSSQSSPASVTSSVQIGLPSSPASRSQTSPTLSLPSTSVASTSGSQGSTSSGTSSPVASSSSTPGSIATSRTLEGTTSRTSLTSSTSQSLSSSNRSQSVALSTSSPRKESSATSIPLPSSARSSTVPNKENSRATNTHTSVSLVTGSETVSTSASAVAIRSPAPSLSLAGGSTKSLPAVTSSRPTSTQISNKDTESVFPTSALVASLSSNMESILSKVIPSITATTNKGTLPTTTFENPLPSMSLSVSEGVTGAEKDRLIQAQYAAIAQFIQWLRQLLHLY